VTEGPWSSAKRATEAPRKRVAPNWAFFLLIYLGLAFVLGLVAQILITVGVPVPGVLVNLAVLYGAILFAGNRYLKAAGGVWTREDRRRVALAYAAVVAVLNLVVTGLLLWLLFSGDLAPEVSAGLPPDMLDQIKTLGPVGASIGLGIGILVLTAICYGLSRFILYAHVNKNARSGDDVSKEFA